MSKRRDYQHIASLSVTMWGEARVGISCDCGLTNALVILVSEMNEVAKGACHACHKEYRLKGKYPSYRIDSRPGIEPLNLDTATETSERSENDG